MPRVACACGARYQLPDTAVGRRARCKKCGGVFEVGAAANDPAEAAGPPKSIAKPAAPPRAAPAATPAQPAVDGHDDWLALAAGEAVAVERDDELAEAQPIAAEVRYVPEAKLARVRAPALLSDCAALARRLPGALTLPFALGNLITLFFLVILIVMREFVVYAGLYGYVGWLIITGWYMSFQYNVVEGAAANEPDLPSFGLTEGVYEDVVVPLFKYVLTFLLCLAPFVSACLYVWAVLASGDAQTLIDLLETAFGAGKGAAVATTATAVLLGGGLLLGMFFFPIMLLVGAVGGAGAMFRMDLMLKTMMRTFLAYLLVLLVNGVGAVAYWSSDWLADELSGKDLGNALMLRLVFGALLLYLNVVAMRMTGLYYHCCKQRFAWNWE